MSRKHYLYERKLSGIRSDGERVDISVALGAPYKDDKFNSWACPVKAEGLFSRLEDLRGINSARAGKHARQFVIWLLHDFLDKGGKLYIFDGDNELTKKEINEIL